MKRASGAVKESPNNRRNAGDQQQKHGHQRLHGQETTCATPTVKEAGEKTSKVQTNAAVALSFTAKGAEDQEAGSTHPPQAGTQKGSDLATTNNFHHQNNNNNNYRQLVE